MLPLKTDRLRYAWLTETLDSKYLNAQPPTFLSLLVAKGYFCEKKEGKMIDNMGKMCIVCSS